MARYSKRQVVEAGKLIALRNEQVTDELVAAFQLAHDWRGSHLRPMRRVRHELSKFAHRDGHDAVVAARLKRMQSIRRKMQRRPLTLFQMHDIAGARAIVDEMSAVERIVRAYRDGQSKFTVDREWDYISTPKAGGYRSHHLRVRYATGSEAAAYAHLSVEVQVRTRLQHAWATAVEAVGLVRNEELKSGVGDPDWLRLFSLMSGELAAAESQPVGADVPSSPTERVAELRDLADRLDAVPTLENYNQAIRATESLPTSPGMLYLIQYDNKKRQVTVTAYSRFSRMYQDFGEQEAQDQEADTVSVEVDRVEDLRQAYPNYFLDVRAFTDHLKRAVYGQPPAPVSSASTYAQASRPDTRPRKWGPLSWLVDYERPPRRTREE